MMNPSEAIQNQILIAINFYQDAIGNISMASELQEIIALFTERAMPAC